MRRALLLVAAALLLAGCSAPVHYPPGGPPDPGSDTVGWERGFWYNETAPVTTEDGLNASERRMVVARATARVEHLRGVEFDEPVQVELLSRSEYRDRILGNASESSGGPSDATLMDNAVYEALFLVGERADSGEQRRETQASQVLGFYSPSRDEIVVISESETPVIAETTLGHELVHAYQFRHFDPRYNTSTLESKNRDLGLIEGDASLVDYRYEERCGVEWSCVERSSSSGSGGSGGGSASVHQGLSVLNYFPYSDGPIFVRTLQERGGWSAVNDAYDDPPASAEQVALPAKYNADPPVNVTVTNHNGSAWRRVTPRGPNYGSFGVPSITTMFAYPSYDRSQRREGIVDPRTFLTSGDDSSLDPIDYVIPYSDGWEGDRMAAYVRSDGELGYVWKSAWENESEAREFVGGYRDLLRYWGAERVRDGVWRIPEDGSEFADAFAVRVEGNNVTITNAPSVDALRGVNARAEG